MLLKFSHNFLFFHRLGTKVMQLAVDRRKETTNGKGKIWLFIIYIQIICNRFFFYMLVQLLYIFFNNFNIIHYIWICNKGKLLFLMYYLHYIFVVQMSVTWLLWFLQGQLTEFTWRIYYGMILNTKPIIETELYLWSNILMHIVSYCIFYCL